MANSVAKLLETLKDGTVTMTVPGVRDELLKGVRIESVESDHVVVVTGQHQDRLFVPFASISLIRKG